MRADATIRPAAIGRKSTAVWYADALATTCKYNAVKKKMEKVPKYATNATKLDPANGGSRNIDRSSIGLLTLFSVMTKAMPDTPQRTKSVTIHGEV